MVISNSNDPRMMALRAKMKVLKIDINVSENGVFIPTSSAVKKAAMDRDYLASVLAGSGLS
ncbi:hypothetical protein WAC87_004160 [Shigella flexneri]